MDENRNLFWFEKKKETIFFILQPEPKTAQRINSSEKCITMLQYF